VLKELFLIELKGVKRLLESAADRVDRVGLEGMA
jgi:hypothetical protein